MNTMLKIIFSLVVICSSPANAWMSNATVSGTAQNNAPANKAEHDAWLKERFSEQHENLIPIVAVADMFFTCNQLRKIDEKNYQLAELINTMDKNVLAEKLSVCLGADKMKSDVALNFGLQGCFHDQLTHLPEEDRKQKMKLVKKAIASLSQNERAKSFTQCVTEQAIRYLQ